MAASLDGKVERAKRAFERRMGKSVLPLKARRFKHANGADCVRIFDPETGSWVEYNISWNRIGKIREFDAAAQEFGACTNGFLNAEEKAIAAEFTDLRL